MGKVEISEQGINSLMNMLKDNMNEERNLALERYRRQDESIENNEQFILQGKYLVDFLKTASDRTDALMNLTKMISSIVYKDDTGSKPVMDDALIKSEILKHLENEKNDLGTDIK
jgi:hypothetical protein